jgi:hypothetical protein
MELQAMLEQVVLPAVVLAALEGMDQVAVAVAVVAMVALYQLTYHNPVGRVQQEPFVLFGPVTLDRFPQLTLGICDEPLY